MADNSGSGSTTVLAFIVGALLIAVVGQGQRKAEAKDQAKAQEQAEHGPSLPYRRNRGNPKPLCTLLSARGAKGEFRCVHSS